MRQNEYILNGLDTYIRDVNPQYAILIKGAWGSGKTFFIKHWLDSLSKQENQSTVQPFYISLFGLSSIPALTDKINKTISPIFYNIRKYGTEILKMASKAVLKYEGALTDIKGLKLAYEINPIDLLMIKDKEDSDTHFDYTLFVFDDLERCKIAPEELMGFFDHLLEQTGCRVVIVLGNEDAQDAKWKEVMTKYQEKIVGREYSVLPDLNEAVLYFVKELEVTHPKSYQFMMSHQEVICDMFMCSKYNNLRSLRHTIRAFAEVYEKLDNCTPEFDVTLLIQYFAYSIEYFCGAKEVVKTLDISYFNYYSQNQETEEKKLINKYIPIQQKYQIRVFDPETFGNVKESVLNGKDLTKDLNVRIKQINNKSLSERLRNIWSMSNTQADKLIRETRNYLLQPIEDVSEYLYCLYMICYLEETKVVRLRKSFEKEAFVLIKKWIASNLNSTNFANIQHCINMATSIQFREKSLSRYDWLISQICNLFDTYKISIKEPLVDAIKHISDANIEDIIIMMNNVDPSGRANYNMQSIFQKVDVPKMCCAINKLSNQHKRLFTDALIARYGKNWRHSDFCSLFAEERVALQEMHAIFNKYASKATKINRLALQSIIIEIQNALNQFDDNQ